MPEPESTDAIFAEHAGCPLEAAYHALGVAVAGKRLREAYIEALERSDAQDKRALLCRMRCKDAPPHRDAETQLRRFQYLLSEMWMRALDAGRTLHLVHRKHDHERVALGALRQNLCILRRDIDASLMSEVHDAGSVKPQVFRLDRELPAQAHTRQAIPEAGSGHRARRTLRDRLPPLG